MAPLTRPERLLPFLLADGEEGHTLIRGGDGVYRTRRLPFWDLTWSGATAYADGTAYASMTDSSAAIQEAIATAASLGVPVVGCGTYRVDSTITLDIDHDFAGATWVCSDTALAPLVRIGTATSGQSVHRLRGVAPKVINAVKTGTGWTGASVGVELANLYSSDITIPYVTGFTTGVLMSAYGAAGNVYNRVYPHHLYNNQCNLALAPQDTSGWVNENQITGGRLAFHSNEGTDVAGTRQVLLETLNGGHPVNNNRFISMSLEGDVPEYHAELIGALYNVFEYCRWEAATPRIVFNDVGLVGSSENLIFYGYNASTITITEDTNSVRNHRYSRYGMEIETTAGADGALILANRSSNTSPVITLLSAGDSPHDVTPATDYLTAFTPAYWNGKAKTDAEPRIQVTATAGVIDFGNGTNPVDVRIQRLAGNIGGTASGDKWVANAGLGVGNSAAASTLGTVTRKMEVFDATGASIGFVPIYDAIT